MNQNKIKSKLNSSLTKKLSAYSSVACASLLISNSASAKVVYTDIPDHTQAINPIYELDIDGNGTKEFNIRFISSYGVVDINDLNNNKVLIKTGSICYSFPVPYALNNDQEISINAPTGISWGAGNHNPLNCQGACGLFIDKSEKFVGVKFERSGNIHYGWVRLSVNQDGSQYTVHDYAYEDVAGAPITSGDTESEPVELPIQASIPTLTEWGQILMAGLLLLGGIKMMRNREETGW